MVDQNDGSSSAPPPGGTGGQSRGDGGSAGGGGGSNRNRQRNRNRNRNRGPKRPAGSDSADSTGRSGGQTGPGTGTTPGGNQGNRGNRSNQTKGSGRGGNNRGAGSRADAGVSRGSGGDSGTNPGRGGRGGGKSSSAGSGNRRSGSGSSMKSDARSARSGTGRPSGGTGGGVATKPVAAASVATAPAPALSAHGASGLGATPIHPAEVAANRTRSISLCAWTAAIPAIVIGAVLTVAVHVMAGIIWLVVVEVLVAFGLWRVAPRVSMRRIGAVPADEHEFPGLYNITEGLCATFGVRMPVLHVVEDAVPNACALGRDTRSSDLVVTTGLLRVLGPVELEGVIAHELAHVKRGDNGVSSVAVTLACLFGGEATLRRCVGVKAHREYRADGLAASAVRYPLGLLDALHLMMNAPAPVPGSVFAAPRFGGTRWVWIDPSVGHRHDPVAPGDLDATSVRAAALNEW